MNRKIILFAIGLILALTGFPADRPLARGEAENDTPFAYHVRLVRVNGAGAEAGAALGWAPDDGEPVVLPGYEVWGSPEQLEALAETLGADRADAVTGFFLTAGHEGVPRFERAVYLGEAVLDLSFRAFPPSGPDGVHEVDLELVERGAAGPPLTEAKLRLRTDRTVAVACPSVDENGWLVLAVTLLDQRTVEKQVEEFGSIRHPKDADVTMPKILTKIEPKYPASARKAKLSGEIVLEVILGADGVPHAPTVVSMTPGTEELAAAAVDAVMRWRYAPATLDGEPVPVYFRVTVQFKLS